MLWRLGPFRTCYVRLGYVRPVKALLDLVRAGQFTFGNVSAGYVRLGQFRPCQARLRQVISA